MPVVRQWQMKQPKTYYDVKSQMGQYRIIINQGGTRSGKTYSTIQVLVEFCKRNEGKGLIISIVRKTSPSLKATAYRDFVEILQREGWYDETFHNKTAMEYVLFGNIIEFFAIDEPQKVRGRRRNILFINEANELTYEEFFQLNIRTTHQVIIDFNPSDEFLWIYDLEERNDTVLNVTNYTHNPYLEAGLIEEIERLEAADEDYWRVYGMGLRGASREIIFTHWREVDELPGLGITVFGQDFGFNVPSALVKVEFFNGAVYADELLYKPKLITSDIAQEYERLTSRAEMNGYDTIYCDAAAADSIEELQRMGWNAHKAHKDVLEGINKLKSLPLFITRRSHNLIKEIRNYKWKIDKKTEKVLDEPVKFNDHATDALRYAVYSYTARPRKQRSYSA